jgi:predicted HicB family RNase H-like nuclease
MSQLTLSLPETLHHQLTILAYRERVSLTQYILYALTRQATLASTVQPLPENDIREQQVSFNTQLSSLGEASSEEISATLAEREIVEPEAELSPKIVKRLQKRIADKQ